MCLQYAPRHSLRLGVALAIQALLAADPRWRESYMADFPKLRSFLMEVANARDSEQMIESKAVAFDVFAALMRWAAGSVELWVFP